MKIFRLMALVIATLCALAGNATAQTSNVTFRLTWTDNSSNEEGFYVYRDGVKVGQVGVNIVTYTESVTGNWGQQYSYQVSAFNHEFVDGSGALQESPKSPAATGTIPIPSQPAPAAPSGLQMSAVSSSALDLKWIDNANNETSQEIRLAQSAPPREWTIPVAADTTKYRITKLKKKTNYQAKVRAVGDGGVSEYSETASAATKR